LHLPLLDNVTAAELLTDQWILRGV
jgi:hypothetical protein